MVKGNETMDNCVGCKHSKFDEVWGEYKCLQRAVYLPIILEAKECPFFEKKKEKK